jgi:hypothetical protein
MTLEHAITAEGTTDVRTIAQVAVVRMLHDATAPWSEAQRAILEPLVRP